MMTNMLQLCRYALNIMEMYICTGFSFFLCCFVPKVLSSAKSFGLKSNLESFGNVAEMISQYIILMKQK